MRKAEDHAGRHAAGLGIDCRFLQGIGVAFPKPKVDQPQTDRRRQVSVPTSPMGTGSSCASPIIGATIGILADFPARAFIRDNQRRSRLDDLWVILGERLP